MVKKVKLFMICHSVLLFLNICINIILIFKLIDLKFEFITINSVLISLKVFGYLVFCMFYLLSTDDCMLVKSTVKTIFFYLFIGGKITL